MGHKKKRTKPNKSETSSSEQETQSSDQQSNDSSSLSSESEQQKIENKRLSKKDLKTLIKLEKQIEKQQKLLRKIKQAKKCKQQKKQQTKKQIVYEQQERHTQLSNNLETGEGKKLFITGIPYKYCFQDVQQELKVVLKNVEGATGLRVKRKEGCPTYAFIDFVTKEAAKIGLEKLKRKKVFGEKIAIYYSQDQKKQNVKGKQCFECKQFGHFARQCQNKKKIEPEKNEYKDNFDYKQFQKQTQQSPKPQIKNEEPQEQGRPQGNNNNNNNNSSNDNGGQKLLIKRPIREKSRSWWLMGQT